MKNNLREIRLRRGMTLEQVADGADTSVAMIQKLEKGERRLNVDWMESIARTLNVRPEDLIADPQKVLIRGNVGAGGKVFPHDDLPLFPNMMTAAERDQINGEFEEAPPGFDPNAVVALRVVGTSMLPFMPPGTVVYISRRFDGGVPDDYTAKLCVVQKEDGETLLKIVRRSHLHGRFDLVSYNMETISDVQLAWCAPVIFIKPF